MEKVCLCSSVSFLLLSWILACVHPFLLHALPPSAVCDGKSGGEGDLKLNWKVLSLGAG